MGCCCWRWGNWPFAAEEVWWGWDQNRLRFGYDLISKLASSMLSLVSSMRRGVSTWSKSSFVSSCKCLVSSCNWTPRRGSFLSSAVARTFPSRLSTSPLKSSLIQEKADFRNVYWILVKANLWQCCEWDMLTTRMESSPSSSPLVEMLFWNASQGLCIISLGSTGHLRYLIKSLANDSF